MATESRDEPTPGTLYVVATPIGNLEDITERARRVLGEAELVLAEDTRRVRTLLSAMNVSTPVESYHGDTHPDKRARLIDRLASGAVMALASDAGTPALSDPGATLVREAAERGVRIVPVPGASAVTAALSASGLPAHRFEFAGYPPRREDQRRQFLARLVASPVTSVFFEAPHRLRDCLADLQEVAGPEQPVIICRELTKLHEEILRTTVAGAIERFAGQQPRGELSVLLPPGEDHDEHALDEAALRDAGCRLLDAGISTRDAADLLSELTGRGRNELYDLLLELRG
ncbi:MAG: 16S rRNA (cytidine(1402)-2'-O)-methyltransferase [Armatimonadota bacterium]|nr:16S rRNA (cytidine(1402)-2'-O)-methyltransferase [Armatimonadota bacterium]